MTTFLLDANVLIALTHPEHAHHGPARRWFGSEREVAMCPISQGALVRFMIRMGEPARVVADTMRVLSEHPRVRVWADDVDYADVDLADVTGHGQVTDVYLAALAVRHGGRLATFDQGLAQLRPDACELVPG